MRKVSVFLLILIILMSSISISYSSNEGDNMKNDVFYKFLFTDSEALEDIIHTEYHLDNLVSFFGLGSSYKLVNSSEERKRLTISIVNNLFPIEIIRSNKYSVYKVIEGGLFFVFWAIPINVKEEPIVDFTAYISDKKDPSLFDKLIVGVNSAYDVRNIDPNSEMQLRLSRGIYSYSYVDKETLVEIMYCTNSEKADDLNHYIISRISVVRRENAPSYYRLILSKDLPE